MFDDGSDVNEVIYNSSGQIVEGVFKIPKGWGGQMRLRGLRMKR